MSQVNKLQDNPGPVSFTVTEWLLLTSQGSLGRLVIEIVWAATIKDPCVQSDLAKKSAPVEFFPQMAFIIAKLSSDVMPSGAKLQAIDKQREY